MRFPTTDAPTASARYPFVIVQPNMAGHRFNYCRMLVESTGEDPTNCLLITSSAGARAFERKAPTASRRAEVLVHDAPTHLRSLASLSALVEEDGVIVVPDGDQLVLGVLGSLGWRRPGHLRLLIMRKAAQTGRLLTVRSLLRTIAYAVANLMPRVEVVVLRSMFDSRSGPLPSVVDPIEFAPEPPVEAKLRTRHSLDDSRYWFLVIGSLDVRKNIPLILDALEVASLIAARPLGIVLAGGQSVPVRESLRLRPKASNIRVVIDDRYLNEVEFDSYFRVVDAVILAHSNEGPSGIMGKAYMAGNRIIAAGARSLREDCKAIPHVASWCQLEPQNMAAALSHASRLPRPDAPISAHAASAFASRLLGGVGAHRTGA